jgi:hypothetical protein
VSFPRGPGAQLLTRPLPRGPESNPMIGIGIQRAGVTGAGTGEPSTIGVPPEPGQGAPFLTSQGDYVIDPATRDIGRTTSARHRVQLALQTNLMSATADISIGISNPRKINQSFESDGQAATRKALQPTVDDSSISVDDVQFEILKHSPGAVARTVAYTDLQNSSADKKIR